jgi:lysophospholipase L1-like esterase
MTSSSPRVRRRTAIAGVGAGFALLAATIAPALAAPGKHPTPAKPVKKNQPVVAGSRYLALGDSVPFGYREPNAIDKPHFAHAKNLVGFPEDVARGLGLKLTNAACPGETTASFLNTSKQSNGCENTYSKGHPPQAGGYRTLYPLHTKYKNSKQSQLAFAEAYLKAHPNTRLVSVMIGANDGRICQQQYSDGCVGELSQVSAQITRNTKKIFKGLRKTAHYRGQLVLMTYYSFDYTSGLDTIEFNTLNNAVEKAAKPYHVTIADGYGKFEQAAANGGGDSCTAGLLVALKTDPASCGIHPSRAGQALLALAEEQAIKK